MADSGSSSSTRTSRCVTLGIAGGSGSGKTTLARAIYDRLGGANNPHALVIVHDSYYKCLAHLSNEARAQHNFDHPDSLDTALLVQHVQDLKHPPHDTTRVHIPHYDFTTHSRIPDQVTTIVPHDIQIIIMEGILLFTNPELVAEMDVKVFVDAEADVRILRRMTRDVAERGRTVPDVMRQYQSTVRPMHDEFVEPSKKRADVVVSTTTGHDMKVVMDMLVTYLKAQAGVTTAETTTITR